MSCSRRYCAECNHSLRGIVSDQFHEVTASVDDKKDGGTLKPSSISATSTSISPSGKAVQYKQTRMQEIVYTLVKGKEAVDDTIYERFYVPSIVQKVINSMTGVAYDFSSTRLTKSSPESSEKRKKLDEERKIRPTA